MDPIRKLLKTAKCGLRVLIPALLLLHAWGTAALSAVSGECSNCHTMHNSEGGVAVVTQPGGWPNNSQPRLTKKGCGPCHSGVNDGTNTTPFVWGAGASYGNTGTEAGTNTLAGGTFQFVGKLESTSPKGHNVMTPHLPDFRLTEPPGFVVGFDAHGQVGSDWANNSLSCQGTYGCHGQHNGEGVRGGHHADDSTIDGSTVGKSFRFLLGVKGKESPNWEYQPTANQHNQYYGIARTTDTAEDSNTISYLCARCHGNFHSGAGNAGTSGDSGFGTPWLRHPTDFDMNAVKAKEYGNYGGAGVNAYSVVAPVASTDVSAVKSQVLLGAGDAIVTCISCHRAHGSDYPAMLRWNYDNCDAGTANNNCGCFVCHTTKDGS